MSIIKDFKDWKWIYNALFEDIKKTEQQNKNRIMWDWDHGIKMQFHMATLTVAQDCGEKKDWLIHKELQGNCVQIDLRNILKHGQWCLG